MSNFPPSHDHGSSLNTDRLDSMIVEISPHVDDTLFSYSQIVISGESEWGVHQGERSTPLFVETVGQNVRDLLLKSGDEDVVIAQQVLIGYGVTLRRASNLSDTSYMSWTSKLRRLAGIEAVRKNVQLPDKTELDFSAESFWLDVYTKTVDEYQSVTALVNYVIGPDTEKKSSKVFSNVIDELQDKSWKEAFPGSSLTRNASVAAQTVSDAFKNMLGEIADAGWPNVAFVKKMLAANTGRDIPIHVALIHTANQVTKLLNQVNEIPLNQLDTRNPQHISEALNRCLSLALDFGEQPKGHDSLNFHLKGEVLCKIADEIDGLLRK